MQIRTFLVLIGSVLLLLAKATPSLAENKIQAYVADGRVIFTNLVDNTPLQAQVTTVPTEKPVQKPVLTEKTVPTGKTSDLLVNEMPESLRTLVDTIATNHRVDPALVRAVMKTESNFNRWARSPKGAMGLMQLIPDTGRRYGVSDFYDPQQNVEGGVRYLRFLLDKFDGNVDLALAGYNAGENLVARLGRIPKIPETTNYVRKIRAMYKATPEPVMAEPPALATAKAETPRIYRVVDERGVVHFSNVAPPN